MGHVRMVAARCGARPWPEWGHSDGSPARAARDGIFTAADAVGSPPHDSRRPNRDADRRRRRAAQASGMVRGALGWTAVADRGELHGRRSTIIFAPSADPNETITRSAGRVMLMAVRLPMSSSLCRPRDA